MNDATYARRSRDVQKQLRKQGSDIRDMSMSAGSSAMYVLMYSVAAFKSPPPPEPEPPLTFMMVLKTLRPWFVR